VLPQGVPIATKPNGESGYSTRRHVLGRESERPEAVSPARGVALTDLHSCIDCQETFLSLSLSLSLSASKKIIETQLSSILSQPFMQHLYNHSSLLK
jgi:hypothetical protein